jgi:flagellar hook-associated protein 1 FlgK
MSSSFSGLQTGLSALIAHRQAAEVIAHNIANVNTEGYSRQRVELQAEGRPPVTAIWARTSDVGTGVRAESITRIRNEFLESQHRNELASAGSLDGTAAVLNRLEGAFPEPSDTGIAAQLSNYWASWQAVVNNPESEAARSDVLEKGNLVVQSLHLADRQMRTQREDAVTNVGLMVGEANQIAEQIARYNTGIRAATVGGQQPNDLLDQRDELVLQLSQLTGAKVSAGEHGMVDVHIGGRAIVNGQNFQKLAVTTVADPTLGALGLDKARVSWAADGLPTDMASGEIAGYVLGANEVIPQYLTKLNTVASQLVTSVNTIHTTGKDLSGTTGRTFFDPTRTTAANIAISADVDGKPRQLAVAGVTGGALDTTVAESLGKLGKATIGADSTYRAMIVSLGSEVQFFNNQTDAQMGVVARLDEDRKSASGVNLDEEMVNLVASQHAYSAAARVITTVDEMLDTLINRTGVVGR